MMIIRTSPIIQIWVYCISSYYLMLLTSQLYYYEEIMENWLQYYEQTLIFYLVTYVMAYLENTLGGHVCLWPLTYQL